MDSEYYLYHHGVKGMKWGVRKKRDGPTSVRTARKQAKKAGRQAAKDTINDMNASPKKHTLREYNNHARKAKRQAEIDTYRDAKAANKQRRAEKKAMAAKLKDTYRKIKRGEIQEMFDYDTGSRLGYLDVKTGQPVKYGDVASAVSYANRQKAIAYIATVGTITVASAVASLIDA